MKKRDRLTAKKKRKYRIDHVAAYKRWEEKLNRPFVELMEITRKKLLGIK